MGYCNIWKWTHTESKIGNKFQGERFHSEWILNASSFIRCFLDKWAYKIPMQVTLVGHVDGNIKFLGYLCQPREHLSQFLLQIASIAFWGGELQRETLDILRKRCHHGILKKKWEKLISTCRSASSPLPVKSTRKRAITESTIWNHVVKQ